LFPLFLSLAVAAPAGALAKEPVAAAAQKERASLVVVANTGLEDVQTLSSSLRHAVGAKQSGHLDEVVWLVFGRAIVLLDPDVGAVPDGLKADLKAAQEAGVRIVACGQALAKFDIDPARLPPGVEVVPNGMGELARLVADGYAVLRY
jgi:intracellular sulfur oxidation DsrE/DsrF family protein